MKRVTEKTGASKIALSAESLIFPDQADHKTDNSHDSEQKEKNVMCQTVELIPSESKSKNVFKVRLTINKSQKTIVAAKIFDKNGTIQTISVDKFLPDGASDESNFIFNKDNYPGSEIVDLR